MKADNGAKPIKLKAMTKQELNRDIKRLGAAWKKLQTNSEPTQAYYDALEDKIVPELLRLYYADREMEYMNAESIKTLLRINLSLRVIELYQFGLFIEL